MAEVLQISPSYLNLIERNQRPLTAAIMLRLADRYDFDPRTLSGAAPGGGVEAIRRRLADPMFEDLDMDRSAIADWIASAPEAAEAFARAFDRGGAVITVSRDPVVEVRAEIERWRNHFADLDTQAEALADELRLASGDLYGAISDRLRVKHQLSLRVLPIDIMPDRLHRLDLHARQLQLSELLDPASRTFAAAFQLAQLEARAEIDGLVAGGAFADRAGERMFRRHLNGYFAAAVMMPYGRFLRACEATGYDIDILQRRFGAGFEQVAHRLTTLQRVGARGLPFFMLRIDRAGQSSKRYVGASASPLVGGDARCPLWQVHHAFDRSGEILKQVIELEGGQRWFTMARTVRPQASRAGNIAAEFSICLGVEATLAHPLVYAGGVDLENGPATRTGLGCRDCLRTECPQRSLPPAGRVLTFNERERGLSPFSFAAD